MTDLRRTPLRRLLLLSALMGGASLVEDTATGNPVTFDTDVAKPLVSLQVPFTPIQEGTGDPSPQNIRNILPWNGLKVFHAGKNILALTANSPIKDIDTGADTTIKRTNLEIGAIYEGVTQNNYWRGETANRYIVNRANGGLTFATNDGAYGFGVCVCLNPNTKYTLSYTGEGVAIRTAQYAKDGTHVKGQNLGKTNPVTFTSASDVAYALIILTCDVNHTNQEVTISNVLLEVGETASAYDEYTPITETDISFPSPVYGGEHEAVSGRLMNEWAEIASYNGETLPGEWLSDRDVYSAGTTPTIGAQVVYKLATPTEQTLTGHQITALVGDNTIWSDADGSMTAVYLKKG